MTAPIFVPGFLEPEPRLTSRQAECLKFIWTYFERERQYPLAREITTAMGIQSSTAASLLDPLVKKGALVRVTKGPRNLRITELGMRLVSKMGLTEAQLELG